MLIILKLLNKHIFKIAYLHTTYLAKQKHLFGKPFISKHDRNQLFFYKFARAIKITRAFYEQIE